MSGERETHGQRGDDWRKEESCERRTQKGRDRERQRVERDRGVVRERPGKERG